MNIDKDISRRDFLKLTVASVSALAFRNKNKVIIEAEPEPQISVKFIFDNHVLSPDLLDPKTKVIMGESNFSNLSARRSYTPTPEDYQALDQNPIQSFIDRKVYGFQNAGIGSTDHDSRVHNLTLASLPNKGVELIATDKFFANTVSYEKSEHYTELIKNIYITQQRSEMVVVPGTSIFNMFLIRQISKNILNEMSEETKENIGSALGVTGGFLTLGLLTNLVINQQETISEILGKDYLEKSMASFVINQRNYNMAHNIRLSETILEQNLDLSNRISQDTKNIPLIAFAGSGHFRMESIYQMGEMAISKEIKNQIHSNIDDTILMLKRIDIGLAKDITEKDFLDFWTHTVSCYNFPIASFYEYDEYKNHPRIDIPQSARKMLWRELLSRLSNEEIKPFVIKLMARLTKEDLTFFDSEARKLPEIDAMAERMKRLSTGRIPLYPTLANQNPGGKPVLVNFEGVPFVMEQKDLGEEIIDW